MQVLGKIAINGSSCILLDDYGHHPSEIKSTIESIRESYPNKELNMVFQPHRFTRTKDLFLEFVNVLMKVDNLTLLDIYSAGEPSIKGISSKALMKKLIDSGFKKVRILNTGKEIMDFHKDQMSKDSVLIMQGAGDISKISSEIKRTYIN